MTKSIHVTMPDGSVWSVPAHLAAEPRARYYAEHDTKASSGAEFDAVYAQELDAADDDDIIDWAHNNMNWSEVEKNAVRVGGPPMPDYQDGWCNGEMRIVNE